MRRIRKTQQIAPRIVQEIWCMRGKKNTHTHRTMHGKVEDEEKKKNESSEQEKR